MAITLKLKIREVLPPAGSFTMPFSMIARFYQGEGDPKGLYAFLNPLAPEKVLVHDKEHLLLLINWKTEKQPPYSERAKWHKLIPRVNALKEDKEGSFTISPFQRDLIWQRLKSKDFNPQPNPAFDEFIMDFQKATGLHFEHEEPEAEGE